MCVGLFLSSVYSLFHSPSLMFTELIMRVYNFDRGLFTENCFVLAEGPYEDEIFHVSACGFPPPEPSIVTRYYLYIIAK